VQLVRVADGASTLTGTFDQRLLESFSWRFDRESIVTSLSGSCRPKNVAAPHRIQTENKPGLELYMRGR